MTYMPSSCASALILSCFLDQRISSSVTSMAKCLSTFLRLTSRPTRRLIASWPRSRGCGERTARRSEHAAVAHQRDGLEAEALLDLLHLHPDRARIRRVAGEHIYGHGTAVGRAEQAADDLLLALLAVPVVAERGQWGTESLQIAGRDIVEQQGGALEMPSGEALLDPRLPPQQPVEHVEHFVAADGTEAEQGTEAAGGGLRGQAASGGELGAGLEYAGDYGGEGEVTPAAAAALQEALEAKLTADAEDGGDMAMGQGAADAEGLLAGAIDLAAAEHGADAVDDLGGQFGEVGEGGAADALAVALGLAEEDGGGAVAVGDDVDVVGHGARPITWKQYRTQLYCVKHK